MATETGIGQADEEYGGGPTIGAEALPPVDKDYAAQQWAVEQQWLEQQIRQGWAEGTAVGESLFQEQYGQQVELLIDILQANVPDVQEWRARPYVQEYLRSWLQDYGRAPSVGEALNDPGFTLGGMKLPTYADQLPTYFIVNTAQGPVLYDNSTLAGPAPVPISPENYPIRWSPTWDDPQQGAVGFEHAAPQLPAGIPVVSEQDFAAYQQLYEEWRGPGGGGGGGRTAPTFDRRALDETVRSNWQRMLLETPAESSRLVDSYIQEATSFYLETGTQLNMQAWLLEEMRSTPRYRLMYGSKPAGMSEDDYLGRVSGVVGQYGLSPSSEVEQTVKGMASPVNLSSLSERLSRLREYWVGHRGGLSQKFQQTFEGLGVLRGT